MEILHDPRGLERQQFGPKLMSRLAYSIFHWRLPLLILFIVTTIAMGYSATRLKIEAGFEKMVPVNHEYMETYFKYRDTFGGANKFQLAVVARDGNMFTREFFDTLHGVHEEVFYTHGVDRSLLTSLYSPNVMFIDIIEDGFRAGRIVTSDFEGNEEDFRKIRESTLKSTWYGRIVATDFSGALVSGALLETDPETGGPIDLQQFGNRLEEIRTKFENEQLGIHIIGFSKSVSDISNGAQSVLTFFAIAVLITALLLYWYSGSVILTWWALICAVVPVVWLLGLLPLLDLALDPLSILVPFLIFAIGVSHAVQMTNAWKLETIQGADGTTASRNCFLKLFVPGAAALLANAVGFMVIAVVDIQIVRELVITATLGVTLMIVTNKMLLPILLSYLNISAERAQQYKGKESLLDPLWERMGTIARRKYLASTLAIATGVALAVLGFWKAGDLHIGDLGEGVPELQADSRYNQDVAVINSRFTTGIDVLQVVALAKGEMDTPCMQDEVMEALDDFEFFLRQQPGVQAVKGPAGFARGVNQAYSEGNIKWRVIPDNTPQLAQAIGFSTRIRQKIFDRDCEALLVSVYTSDHQATTLERLIETIKVYKAGHDSDKIEFLLASGNVGVMAATNEVVRASEKWVNLTLFVAVMVLCYLQFRTLRVVFAIALPLGLSVVLCNALMATLDIGIKVNTLPVVALGVGVGVDYGIYLFDVIKHQMRQRGHHLSDAFIIALKQRGMSSLFTALMMTLSVATWIFSPLKFQSDMGILLAFMFLVNVLGALLIAPALASWTITGRSRTYKKRMKLQEGI